MKRRNAIYGLRVQVLLLMPCIVMICLCVSAGEENVLTRDGRLLRGKVRQVGAALVVEAPSPRRDIYLSPAVVVERSPHKPMRGPQPEFLFHQDLAEAERKGRISATVKDFSWGVWSQDGTTEAQLKDPVLGDVSFQVFVSRVTPKRVEVQGVEYTWIRSYPTASMANLVLRMIDRQVREAPTATGWLKLAAFHRLRGDTSAAKRALEEARRAGAAKEACASEREALGVNAFLDRLDDLHRWMADGREEDAMREVALLETPRTLEKSDPIRYRQIALKLTALKKRADDYRKALGLLAKRKLPFLSLTPAQTQRLASVLSKGPEQIDEKLIPKLCEDWAQGLAQAKWSEATLKEAIGLADAVAAFFSEEKPAAGKELVARLSTSSVPLMAKVSILRHATRFPEPPADTVRGWKRFEHRPKGARRTLHYYISVPDTYRPDTPTPVVVALHGMSSTAERNYFPQGEVAREGWILINPEYIYGRKWGYQFSEEELLATVGAVRHAAGYLNIDMDRIYLAGYSQGGHASWDIGPAHAGFFAAVAPVIGAPLTPDRWPNLQDIPVYSIGGSKDGKTPIWTRRAMTELARMRTDATYVEYIDRGHEGFQEENDALFAWFRTKRRTRVQNINLVAYRNMELRRRWIDVVATRKRLGNRRQPLMRTPTTRVEGQIKPGNQIELSATNAARIRVLIQPEAIDVNETVTIRVNNRQAFRGKVRLDWALALRECLTRRDRCDIYVAEVLVDVR